MEIGGHLLCKNMGTFSSDFPSPTSAISGRLWKGSVWRWPAPRAGGVLELQEIKKINNNNLDKSDNVIEQNFAKETENIKSDSKDQIVIDNQNSKPD